MKVILLTLILALSTFAKAKEGKQVKIAAFDWCPAICPGKEKPGYIVEIVEEAFKLAGYTIELEYFPWLRAIHQTKTGMSDALLSPAMNEAPTLLYPNHEVGLQKTCFFTRGNDNWKYEGEKSFKDRKVAVVVGNSLEELNSYAKENPQIFIFQHSEDFLPRAIKMFDIKRINTLVYTDSEAKYYFSLHNIKGFKNAGCVSEVKLYIAFSPSNADQSKQLISIFDNSMESIKKTDFIETVMRKYGLKN